MYILNPRCMHNYSGGELTRSTKSTKIFEVWISEYSQFVAHVYTVSLAIRLYHCGQGG